MVVIKVWKHTGYVILFRFYPAIHATRPDGSLCPCHTGPLKAQTLHIKKKKCRCFITSRSLITGILLGDFWGSNKGEHEALIHNSRQSFKCKRLHEPPAWRETFSIKTFILWSLFPAMAFPARRASLRLRRWNAAQTSRDRVTAAVTTGRSGDEGAPSRLYYTAAPLMCRPGNKKPSSAALKVTSRHARASLIGWRASARMTGTSSRRQDAFVADQAWPNYGPGAIRSQLRFWIRPADTEQMTLIERKS